jgi:aerobic-type carbon monoxide dehydrogenase small subunit (CoxS/CutS family)
MPTELVLHLAVNGEPVRAVIAASDTLLELLRGPLGLTGTKHGCDVGDCGACTVIVDDSPRLSCITLAADCGGSDVRTIEGVATGGELHPVQAAFDHHVAAQCGYCTPGFVMTLTHLLQHEPEVDEEGLRRALGSNICRCTGYVKILAAARDAQRQLRATP